MYNFSNFELNIIDKSWRYYHKSQKLDKNDLKRIRICLYLRKSTEDIKDNSLKLQLNEINKFVSVINELYKDSFYFYYDDEDIYAEDNVSGMQGRLRAEFDLMLKKIENCPGYYGVCVVYKLDRFSRKLEDTLKYTSLLKSYKCVLKALDFEDNGDPTSDLLRNMLGVVAQYHAQNSAMTSIKGTIKKVEEHKAVGLLPLGLIPEKIKLGDYNNKGASKIVIDDEKAIIIKEIFEQYAIGKSISDIELYLKDKNYTKYDGTYLSWQQIYYILRNKKYNGIYSYADPLKKHYRKYDNGVKKPDYYESKNAIPKIIDDDLFNRVQNIINLKKGFHHLTSEKSEYLLTGIVFCSMCGCKIHGWSRSKYKGKKYYDYLCPTHKLNKSVCSTKQINKLYIELVITRIVIILLKRIISENQDKIINILNKKVSIKKEDRNVLTKEILKKEKMINKLIDRMVIDESRLKVYENKISILEKDIIILKQKIETIQNSESLDYSLKIQEFLNNESVNLSCINLKLLIMLFIDKILISNDKIEIIYKCHQ